MTVRPSADPGVDKWADEAAEATQERHLRKSRSEIAHHDAVQGADVFDEVEPNVVPHQPEEEDKQLALIVDQRPH